MPAIRAPRPSLAALVVVVGLLAGACSDDPAEEAAPTSMSIRVPEVVDEVCDDPVGDLSTLATVQGELGEPAGIDLVRGEVHLDAETLQVVIETNGDIDAVPGAALTLFQGPPGLLTSWELRFEHEDEGWATTLITYVPGQGRIQVQEVGRPLGASPTVEGSTLTFEVSRASVPPPLTVAWVFGAASADEPPAEATEERTDATVEPAEPQVTAFDECDTVFTEGLAEDGQPDPGTAPPTTR